MTKKYFRTNDDCILEVMTGEARTELTEVNNSKKVKNKALNDLRSAQKMIETHPEISTQKERAAYARAKAAYEENQRELAKLKRQLSSAKRDMRTAMSALMGTRDEIRNFKKQLAEARFNALRKQIEREQTVEVRGEYSCGEDESISKCKRGAMEMAKRNAAEQGSAVLVKSITEIKNFKLTRDEIRSQVKAILMSLQSIE